MMRELFHLGTFFPTGTRGSVLFCTVRERVNVVKYSSIPYPSNTICLGLYETEVLQFTSIFKDSLIG